MFRRSVLSRFAILLIGASLALTLPKCASAQEDQPDSANTRVARLSFIQGDVQYQSSNEDWQAASVNLPIQQGFRLATTDGRAEIQFESGVILRIAENSILEFTELDTLNSGRITNLNLTQGTIIVSADLRPVDSFSVDAPNVHVTVTQPSRFRIDTTQGDSWVGVFAGVVQAKTETGETKVTNGHTFHISGADVNQVSIELNAAPDDFDRWAADRDRAITQGYQAAAQYVGAYTTDYSDYNYGMSDLSSYGYWASVPGYGLCWEPYGISLGWRPFFFGSWRFFPHTGWTWLSSEPWGWLPFHTGHWFQRPGGGWIWQPGPIRAWNPAPVRWFNVGNQLGWAPAGTLNSHGQPPASGIVLGTREQRIGKITPGVRAPLPSELAERITPASAPAPIMYQRGFREGATSGVVPSVRPANFPAEGAVRFDPATRKYVNTYHENKPASADSTDPANDAPPVSNQAGRPAYAPQGSQPQRVGPPRIAAPAPQMQQPPHNSPPPAAPHSAPPPAPHASAPAPHASSGGAHH
jgi:hypothetical protein